MKARRPRHYILKPTPENVHFGFYSADLKPIVTIHSGETVQIETAMGDVPKDIQEPEKSEVRALSEKKKQGGPGPHFLIGPIYIDGAEPGDVLEVQIGKISLRSKYATNRCTAYGILSRIFPEAPRSLFHCLNRKTKVAEDIFPGVSLPLCPFFGSLAVAPPRHYGSISSKLPGTHGGNLDVKELGPGTTLYLPVHVQGALFSCGDGHAAQGDGEVNGTALETSLRGVFTFRIRRDFRLRRPMAETPCYYMTMAFHRNLKTAARIAIQDMVDFLAKRKRLSQENAYALVSLIGEMHVSQLVNVFTGIHFMIPKRIFKERKQQR
jgi:acetamidase/formamidase